MDSDKKDKRKIRYAPEMSDIQSDKKPSSIKKKQEKEYRQQKNKSKSTDKNSD